MRKYLPVLLIATVLGGCAAMEFEEDHFANTLAANDICRTQNGSGSKASYYEYKSHPRVVIVHCGHNYKKRVTVKFSEWERKIAEFKS